MGLATETDIRDCVGETYDPSANVESLFATTTEDNTNGNNTDTDTDDSLSNDVNKIDIWPIP